MGKIVKLDPNLINQIAAGEVVERPVSVVKELLENSIDAGATHISVKIENGGIDSIIVQDNGEGIEKEDLETICEKHTTSKIKNLDDLHNVMSFGFRGEAIASIASVSELSIFSRYKNADQAYKYTDGVIEACALNNGSRFEVIDLFSKTPARLNYLKKAKTEYAKIHDFVKSMALAYPEIRFELENDGKTVFNYSPVQKTESRIGQILGENFAQNILCIESNTAGMSMRAYISDPKIHFQNKNKQYLYVNNRLIQSPMIYRAVYDAYNRYIPHKTFPAYLIHLEIDPTQIDVNVHPRKLEIRFADESSIFRLVYHAIHEKLQGLSLSSTLNLSQSDNTTVSTPQYYTGSGTKFKAYSPYKDTSQNPAQGNIGDAINFSKALYGESNPSITDELVISHNPEDTKLGKIVGQVFNSYIIVEAHDRIQIYDQHALAERIIYEKLIKNAYKASSQGLLLSESFTLQASEYDLIREHESSVRDFGFDFELLGNNILQITAIPDFIKKENLRTIIEGLLEDLASNKIAASETLEEVRNKIAAYTACRSAIKFGHKLSTLEMKALLDDAVNDYSETCPHGRPVIHELSLEEMSKLYDR